MSNVVTAPLECWQLYCTVCTMYALPGEDRCDYCGGKLTPRGRRSAPPSKELKTAAAPDQDPSIKIDNDPLAVKGCA